MASVSTDHKSHEMGLHDEQLAGRTQQIYFSASEEENFVHAYANEVDFDKAMEFDCADMEASDPQPRAKSPSSMSRAGIGGATADPARDEP